MGHHKLERFAENLTFPNLFQVSFEMLQEGGFEHRGKWNEYFGNNNPITLELGCGKGDYTVALARIHPDRNYIGVDIKGARLWRGAKTSNEEQMHNVAFIRTPASSLSSSSLPPTKCRKSGSLSQIPSPRRNTNASPVSDSSATTRNS